MLLYTQNLADIYYLPNFPKGKWKATEHVKFTFCSVTHKKKSRSILLGSFEGGWTALYIDTKQFLQIDVGSVAMVTAIATQGHSANAFWVKTYTLDYGNEDGNFTLYNNRQASIWG